MNDWIEWNGGECPVDSYTPVQVRFKSGGWDTVLAERYDWDHAGCDSDIIAYRIHKKEPKFGEWVKVDDDLPEYDQRVLVSCENFKSVAVLQSITRHAGKNSPKDNRWYAFPGWGHQLDPTHWTPLPDAPA